jgi:hypothetical protein
MLPKLMPELQSLYPRDRLNLSAFPHLKQIVQSDHANILGVIKFKDALVSANLALSGFDIPETTNSSSSPFYEAYRSGPRDLSFTNGEIAERSTQLWENHWHNSAGDDVVDEVMFNEKYRSVTTAKPVFMSVDFEIPLDVTAAVSVPKP